MDELMSVLDVARYLRLHPMTVYRWVKTGYLPASKMGKSLRFKKEEVDEFLKKNLVQTKS